MLSIAKRIGIGEEIVIHKFLQALPTTISPVSASQKELSPTQLGKLADELMPLLNNINATAFTAQHRTQKTEKSKDNIILPTGIKPFFPEQKAKICRAHLLCRASKNLQTLVWMAEEAKHKNTTKLASTYTNSNRLGKLTVRTMSVPLSSPLLQINTRLGTTTLKFIVDTGASISIIPASRLNGVTLNPTTVSLTTANGEKIKCYGQANLEIGIPSLKRSFSWTFVVADITNPLLGFDFLNEFGLIIDCKNKTIYDPLTATKKELILNTTSPVNVVINKVELPSFIQTSQDKYPEIICPHINKNNNYCGVYHRIDTGSHFPVFAKSRQLSAEKLSATKEEFKRLINEGGITPSDSEWSSPLHLVPKQSGGYRCCGDYRALNSITKSDRYPIPNINSFTTKLANKQRFTKIDLISAYHQIKMHPDDIPKTAIICPLGLFHCEFMPFGLKNSSATFQRYMDRIFRQIDCVFI